MADWTIEKMHLPLRYTWVIARGQSDSKTNFYVHVHQGGAKGLGEVAPNIRYQERVEKILSEFALLLHNGLPQVKNMADLHRLLADFEVSKSLRCGLEMAFMDLQAKHNSKKIAEILGMRPYVPVDTLYTIPIMEANRLVDFYKKYDLGRFGRLKLKVDAVHAEALVDALAALTDQPFGIDGNEGWRKPEELMRHLAVWKERGYNILFLEQPYSAYMKDAYVALGAESPYPIFADESLVPGVHFVQLKRQFHGINVKAMKQGGLLECARLLREARVFGMQTMVGCMVETSVAISMAALLGGACDYVDLDSFLYLESEPAQWATELDGKLILHY